MNSILSQYFDRLKSLAIAEGLRYFIYERGELGKLPFSVHFQFEDSLGNKRNSWGTGITKDEAFGKALMEMIERLYFSYYSPFEYVNLAGFFKRSTTLQELSKEMDLSIRHMHPANTNGVAIHLVEKNARISAMLELIERHTILYALVKGVGPNFIQLKNLSNSKNCRFYIWEAPLKTYVAVGAYLDSEGSYFSSGCDFKFEDALVKAEFELNSFLFLKNDSPENHDIVKDDIQSFNRYHRYSGDDSAIRFFETARAGKIPELDKNLFFQTSLPLPAIFHGLTPLPCIRVIHPDVQQLFFDNWENEYLNPRIFGFDQILPGFPHIIA